jgi:hypothetical protein
MARLAAGLWVSAYLRRLAAEGIAAYVLRRGDAVAGAVAVKLATRDGRARAFARGWDPATGVRAWMTLAEGAEAEVDAVLAREARRDPDLWVIEVEDRLGRHLLGEPGLEA